MWAIVLIVRLAHRALHARLHLSSNPDSVAWLEALDLGTNAEDLPDDLVSDTYGRGCELAPASRDGVHV